MQRRIIFIVFCFIYCSFTNVIINAQCIEGGIEIDPGIEHYPVMGLRMVSDGICGAAIALHILDMSTNRIQNINWNCELQWIPGCVIQRYAFGVSQPRLASDNAGGTFIVGSGIDPFMHNYFVTSHIDASGSITNIELFSEPGSRYYPRLIPDGSGGAIIAWQELIGGTNTDIYAQRISSGNSLIWDPGGIAVCEDANYQYEPMLAEDGTGGAIVVWHDYQPGSRLFAQRVYFDGTVLWSVDGIPVCTDDGLKENYSAITDGFNGAIFFWQDDRNGNKDIFAQRIDSDGNVKWMIDGINICCAAGEQDYPNAVPDGMGGAIVCWRDSRAGNYDIYAQRVNSLGEVQWMIDGVPVIHGPGDQRCNRIVPANNGGAILAWVDESGTDADIYAQCIDSSCAFQWGAGYVPVCKVSGDQDAICMVNNCFGGAIISWVDYRNWQWGEIRATHVSAATTSVPESDLIAKFSLKQNYPNPFNPNTVISFNLKEPSHVLLKIYDATGSLVRILVDEYREAKPYDEIWDGKDKNGESVTSGVYFYQITINSIKETKKMVLIR